MSSLETVRRTARGWIGTALAATVMVAGAAFGAHAAQADDDPHQTTAQTEADHILAAFVAPPGSARLTGRPAAAPADLDGPPVRAMTKTQATAVGWYSTPDTPSQVLSWVRAHPPAGTRGQGSGSSTTGPSFVDFQYATPQSSLIVTPAAASDGRTVIRLDASVVWTPSRTSDSLIPPKAVTSVSVFALTGGNAGSALPATETRTLKSSDPTVIDKVVGLLNALTPAPQGVRSCPADDGTRVHILLAGYGEADVSPVGCGGVTLTVRDKPPVRLAGGPELVSQVYALFGVTWTR